MADTKITTNDWQGLIDICEKATPRGGQPEACDFNAHTSHEDAVAMIKGPGYAAAVADAEHLATLIETTVTADLDAIGFTSTYDVCGSEVDMGRFLSGEPECMIESQPIKIARKGRAVRIVVNASARADTPAATIKARGAAVLALVDILSRLQHPLEVWSAEATNPGGRGGTKVPERLVHLVKVQDAAQPVDLARIMFALAHPAMLRQCFFRVCEREPATTRAAYGFQGSGSYGRPESLRPSDLPDEPGSQTIWLSDPMLGHENWDQAACIGWVEKQCADIFR